LKFLNSNLRPKRFDYFPRYYDERKERIDLKRKLYGDEELSEDDRTMLMREKMKENRNNQQIAQNNLYSQNTRSLILIFLVLVLGYFLLNGLDDIDQVIFKLMH